MHDGGVGRRAAGGQADLVFVCTPAAANPELLRAARPRASGPRSSPRPATARPARRAAGRRTSWWPWPTSWGSCWPDRTARASCRRRRTCARRSSRRTRRPGRIAVASQSGNFVSSFMNYAVQTGVGISRAVSAGNAAAVGVADYLGYFAEDPADRGEPGLRRGRRRRARVPRRAWPRRRGQQAARARQGWRAPRAASGRRRATPARSPATTGCSTASAARPAPRGRRRSRRRSRPPRPSPRSPCRPVPTSSC